MNRRGNFTGFDNGSRERLLLVQMEAQRHIQRALDAVDAHLAIALRRVAVAATEERAVIEHRQVEPRPAHSSRTSRLPPNGPGGRVRKAPSSARATPITPRNGRTGTTAGARELVDSPSSCQ
jgi:hypothetical protein